LSKQIQLFIGLTLILIFGGAGCVGPMVKEYEVSEEVAAQLREDVPTLSRSEFRDGNFQSLGTVDATSCFNNFVTDEGSSEEAAMDQLRYEASALGADGLVNPICEKEGTNLQKNCWTSVTCRAIAVRASSRSPADSAGNSPSMSGTCFSVSPDGLALTAAHVVAEANEIELFFPEGESYEARIAAISPSNDLAVLRFAAMDMPYLDAVTTSNVNSGDLVFTIGYPTPEILGYEEKYTDGAISALSGLQGDASLMQITVPVQPGNSGGPVVTQEGDAVGVVTSSAAVRRFAEATGTLPQNLNWAVKMDFALPLLDSVPDDRASLSRNEAVSLARDAVCRVLAR
jgi:S1-C subfamily serine protease